MKVNQSRLRFKNRDNMTQLENVVHSPTFFCELGRWLFQSDSYLICH